MAEAPFPGNAGERGLRTHHHAATASGSSAGCTVWLKDKTMSTAVLAADADLKSIRESSLMIDNQWSR